MIICCGEALIDMLPAQSAAGEDAYVPHTGGAVFNTAIALGRLGAPVGLVSGLSRDLHGQMLIRDLEASGVDTTAAIRSDRPTTLAFVTLKDGQAEYAFYDENTAGRMIEPGDFPQLPTSAQAMFCGGISLVVEPAADAYASFVGAHAPRLPVMMDPNIRPGFIRDEATYRARLNRLLAICDILKISDEDLDWLVPGDEDVLAKARGLNGPGVVVVTQGSKGATGIIGARDVFVPAAPVRVADTVGAGDTFNAGLLAQFHAQGLLEKSALAGLELDALAQAIAFAHRVAGVTVSRAGANPPWASELVP